MLIVFMRNLLYVAGHNITSQRAWQSHPVRPVRARLAPARKSSKMPPMTSPAVGLGPGRPSRTSIMVAAGRAFGSREPDHSVRNPDWLAERLLGTSERELIREHPIAGALEADYQLARQDVQVAGTANFML